MSTELNHKKDTETLDPQDLLLQQLLRLKKYEQPSSSRMLRRKESIMRQVREVQSTQITLSERIALHLPWLFAEPRYGIALLFVVFGLLQFWGVSLQGSRKTKTTEYIKEHPQPASEVDEDLNAIAFTITNQSHYLKHTPKEFSLSPTSHTQEMPPDFFGTKKQNKTTPPSP